MMETPKAAYERMLPARKDFERMAERSAAFTSPHLFPKEGRSPGSETLTPYQSMGAEGLNNLAGIFLLGLLPAGFPFLLLMLDAALKAELAVIEEDEEFEGKPLTEAEQSLGTWEKALLRGIDRADYRTPGDLMLRYLMVAGDCLVELLPEGGQRNYRLNSYVVSRTPKGTPHKVVIKERIFPSQLSDDVLEQYKKAHPDFDPHSEGEGEGAHLNLFTQIVWKKDKYHTRVSLEDVVLDGEDYEKSGPVDDCPFLPLRFYAADDEDYGRGIFGEYHGALRTLEGLTQSVTQGAAAMAKVLFLVRPGGVTSPTTLAKAPNLAFKSGVAEDISTLQVGKFADMQVADRRIVKIEEQLGRIFMLGLVRNAERVSVAEIRFIQDKLERGHPGVMGRLANDWLKPVARHEMRRLERAGALPKLESGVADLVIVTGAAALGRNVEADKIVQVAGEFGSVYGLEALASISDPLVFFKRLLTSRGVDHTGYARTQEQLNKMQQEAQQAQLQSLAAQKAVDVGGDVVGEQLTAPPVSPEQQ